MSLEHFHSEFKRLYMRKRMNPRLDDLVQMLVDKSKADLRRRFNKVVMDTYTVHDREIRKAHDAGGKIAADQITNENLLWKVASQSQSSVKYTIVLQQVCHVAMCLRCRACDVCTHMIECDCVFAKRGKLCKHIHAFCLHKKNVIDSHFRQKRCREIDFEELSILEPFLACTPKRSALPPANQLITPQRHQHKMKKRRLI